MKTWNDLWESQSKKDKWCTGKLLRIFILLKCLVYAGWTQQNINRFMFFDNSFLYFFVSIFLDPRLKREKWRRGHGAISKKWTASNIWIASRHWRLPYEWWALKMDGMTIFQDLIYSWNFCRLIRQYRVRRFHSTIRHGRRNPTVCSSIKHGISSSKC